MNNGTQIIEPQKGGQIPIGACYRLPDFEFYHADSLLKMKELADNSVNCILTDPPYKYLKNQKLEVDFDENIFFNEVKRILKKDGFIVLFGRGTSFYRWNTILADLGFNFKEEFIWDKAMSTSPLMPISRVHETVSIHSKGNGIINKVKVPYLESRQYDFDSIISDINRIRTIFSNSKSMSLVLDYLENNVKSSTSFQHKNNLTVSSEINISDRTLGVVRCIDEGLREKTIIRSDRYDSDSFTKYNVTSDKRKKGDRCIDAINSIEIGMNEKSIIKQTRDHYTAIHPTQKPVKLLERFLALITKEGDLVLDAFAGSCSTGEACLNTKRKFIGYEIDHEYFTKATERLKSVEPLLFSGCL